MTQGKIRERDVAATKDAQVTGAMGEKDGRRARRSAIIREPAVVRRRDQQMALGKVTSNGTVAAAVMVIAALLAVIVANSPAY
ncbi:MAG: hypothetical protein ACI38Z_07800, partial [Parafannyhessea sp.]